MADIPGRHALIRVAASRLVTSSGVLQPGWLEVEGARITRVVAGSPPAGQPVVPNVVPGFVDIHVHGGGGASFADAGASAVRTVVAHHRSQGTTTLCASLMTASAADLAAQVSALEPMVEEGLLAGIHLEGPWLSPLRAGAHMPALLRPPDPTEVRRLLELGRGSIRMVTLAPELDGGIDAVRAIVDLGAVAALGHTDADYDVATRALDAGAGHATHLGNGMRPLHHREPGVVAAVLERSTVVLELINDGVHLHDAVTAAIIRLAGPGRTVLISDGVAASGLPDGRHLVAGEEVTVDGAEVRQLRSGSLAGSVTSLAAGVRRAVLSLGVPLLDAVTMATATPAQALGLHDVGRLEPGAWADLAVLDDDLRVSSVMHRGEWS